MTTRTRFWVLLVSTPVMAFALVGGYLGQVMAKDGTFQHLRVFEDVVSLVVNNYVEEVDLKQAMRGAMRGLADALDADSADLTPDLVKTVESNSSAGPAGVLASWAFTSSGVRSALSGSSPSASPLRAPCIAW